MGLHITRRILGSMKPVQLWDGSLIADECLIALVCKECNLFKGALPSSRGRPITCLCDCHMVVGISYLASV